MAERFVAADASPLRCLQFLYSLALTRSRRGPLEVILVRRLRRNSTVHFPSVAITEVLPNTFSTTAEQKWGLLLGEGHRDARAANPAPYRTSCLSRLQI